MLHGPGLRALRAATAWAAAWALSAAVAAVLTVSEILGLPVPDLVTGGSPAWGQLTTLTQPRALLTTAAAAVVVGACARRVRHARRRPGVLAAALLGLTPVLFTGHSAQAADHGLATTSLVVHVLAATVWVGGLVGLVVHLRRDAAALASAVPAFSGVALVCFALVGASGLLSAWTRLGGSVEAWTSGYGLLVLTKVAAFAALGVVGWVHRRRSVRGLVAGSPRAFLRLAGGEVLLMAATVGLAVALARTPTPAPAAQDVVVPAHGEGHATLALTIDPLTLTGLVTQWQPDAIALPWQPSRSGCTCERCWRPPVAPGAGRRCARRRSSPGSRSSCSPPAAASRCTPRRCSACTSPASSPCRSSSRCCWSSAHRPPSRRASVRPGPGRCAPRWPVPPQERRWRTR